jgi:hypothetical protein
MRAAWLVLPAVLLGCDGAPRSPAEGSRSTEPAARIALSAPETLVGEWRLAGVDGHLVDLPHAITMSIDAERILVVSDCVNLAWSYRYERGRLTTERVAQETWKRSPTSSPLRRMCAAPRPTASK